MFVEEELEEADTPQQAPLARVLVEQVDIVIETTDQYSIIVMLALNTLNRLFLIILLEEVQVEARMTQLYIIMEIMASPLITVLEDVAELLVQHLKTVQV